MKNDAITFLKRAKEFLKQGEEQFALESFANAIAQWPDEPEVWSARAHAFALSKDYGRAVSDLERAIELTYPVEPHLLYARGRMLHLAGDLKRADADFTLLLEVERDEGSLYYTEMAHFFRAAVLLDLGRASEALSELKHVRPETIVYHGNRGVLSVASMRERADPELIVQSDLPLAGG